MELYIIRHGQSTNNVSMIYDMKDREADPPLTDLGLRQADKVADYVANSTNFDRWIDRKSEERHETKGFGITKLYCSPMLRTLQTARPISKALNLPAEVWPDLHEHGGLHLDMGDERGIVGFPGLGRAAITEQFPGYVVPSVITDAGWYDFSRGVEDIASAMARAIRVAATLKQHAMSDQRIALVIHGTFADALLKSILNMLPNHEVYFAMYNTGITRIDFRRDGKIVPRFFNRTLHLAPEDVS
ncbi:MAG: histidine phosphatase family protein [Chloroflexi bacterium]|nr:histidine phosphatase family protein [Chloroflexota bacterium]MCC6893399.1 histidine phosphatase family protein [Anaerolineae bacterium]